MDITIVAMGMAVVALLASGLTYKKLGDIPPSPVKPPARTDLYTKQEVDNMIIGLTNDIEHTRTRAYELMERVHVLENAQ